MTLEARFVTQYREETTDDPGMAMEEDGTVVVIGPGGIRSRPGRADGVVRVLQAGDASWPARPDVLYVEWVGPGNPAPPASDGDTWIQLTS